MLRGLLSVLVFGSALLHIRAEYKGPRVYVYLFKPLTMVFIILLALQGERPDASLYKYAILAGLGFSLVGDIFLMLPLKRVIEGLVSFLVAHLCYIVAFSANIRFSFSSFLLALFLLYVIIMFAVLFPHLGKMRLPVLVYELVIVMMVWRAVERWAQIGDTGALLALAGAILFVISDSAWAINQFVRRYKSAQALILSSYFCAQWLIALSV
ncbi:lysoplasmalogenase [Candidatus Bipolaricaulota bacterium]|nr:lysoplasmalogenase [Candidatus Bipolaricaulota bacterium]